MNMFLKQVVTAAIILFAASTTSAQWLPPNQTSGPIYYNGGNVGIGTSTPGKRLEIDVASNDGLLIKNTAGGSYSAITLNDFANSIGGQLYYQGANAYMGNNDTLVLGSFSATTPVRIVTNGANRMTVGTNGNVGVGTGANPAYPLTVDGDIATAGRLRLTTASLWAPGPGSIQLTTQYGLSLFASAGQYYDFAIWDRTGNGILLVPAGMQQVRFTADMGIEATKKLYLDGISNTYLSEVAPDTISFVTQGAERLRIGPSGNVVQVTGNVLVNGTITGTSVIGAIYQDIAEWVPAATDMAPGTVVVLNPAMHNEVMQSASSYDTTVAGVISVQPGLILGESGERKEMVATTGRVRVRVDASRAPIAVGDLLVTSDKPGMAMRSKAVDVGGIAMHRPGTIIGKALEPLERGEGEILVLLSLQ